MGYGIIGKAIAGAADGGQQANMEAMRASIMAERDATLNKYATQMQTGVVQPFQAQQQQNLLEERGRESDRHWKAFDERTKIMDKHYASTSGGKPSADMQLYNMFRNDQKLAPEDAWKRVETYKKAAASNPAEGARKIAHDLMRTRDEAGLRPGKPGYQSNDQIIATAKQFANQLYSSTSQAGQSPQPQTTSDADASGNPFYAGPVSGYGANPSGAPTPPAVGAPNYSSLWGDEEDDQ